jgi:eukaryotic translation initiation factor 2C
VSYQDHSLTSSSSTHKVNLNEVGVADPNIIDLFCKKDRQTIQAASSSTVDGLSLAIQSGEIALRTGPSKDPNLFVHGAGGRRFFAFQPSFPISGGAEILKGFYQSLRPTQTGLVLNLDLAFSCFWQGGPFLEVAARVLGMGGAGGGGGRGGFRGGYGGGQRGRGGGYGGGYGGGGGGGPPTRITQLAPHEQQTLRKMLNGVLIKPTHRSDAKAEKLTGFSTKPARDVEFTLKGEDRPVTIASYFQRKYNRTLQFPNLPCAVLGRKTMVPLEFCEVLSGTAIPLLRMKPNMTQDMIRQSALKPSARLQRNMEIRRENAYEQSALLKSFDMKVAPEPVLVQARVHNPPQITYGMDRGREGKINPNSGSWNLQNVKFVASGDALKTVVLLNFARVSENDCKQFAQAQLASCRQYGMKIEVRDMHYAQASNDPFRVKEAMTQAGRAAYQLGGKQKPPQLYFCFLDESGSAGAPIYETIKREAATGLASPVATQCVNVKKGLLHDPRKQQQYCANVAMKVSVTRMR